MSSSYVQAILVVKVEAELDPAAVRDANSGISVRSGLDFLDMTVASEHLEDLLIADSGTITLVENN